MRTLLTVTALSSALALAAACGGKKASTTPDEAAGAGGRDYRGDPDEDPCQGGMCPPETLDAIQRALDSKRRAAARCLSDAVNEGKASKDARGHVALAFKITPAGKAQDIQVVQSSIKNPDVEQCVIAEVQQIVFEKVPTTLDWAYTYAFESM
ncbi:MAG: AgmX/PglI C-terminal domain-containing protein [Kofleriaceae bacterium]|nr:MAG: AgmX/PglI C-terminal domain-containing protein [Kofleriaceae bacterium]MBZ0237540.1 AgmX/PglI C-terminal domain-containing protein [Kofleriaceae bacterium]